MKTIARLIVQADLAIVNRMAWTQGTCTALTAARDEAQHFLDHRDALKGMYEDIGAARRMTDALRRFGETPP